MSEKDQREILKEEIKVEVLEERKREQAKKEEAEQKLHDRNFEKEELSHGQKFLKGFDYAYEGLVWAINHEKNMKFHMFALAILLVASLFFNLSRVEMITLVFAVCFVLAFELINTSVEQAVNLASKGKYSSFAKASKDLAAAATFIAALNALFVAYLIFFDKFIDFYNSVIVRIVRRPSHLAIITLSLVIVVTIFLKGVFYEGHGTAFKGGFVSGHTSIAFGIATIGMFLTTDPLIRLMLIGLALIVAESRYEANIHSMAEIIRGAILGTSMAMAIFGIFS
ncbi:MULTISPECIES: diacylglycerol kinase [Anaerococcus]|jgi:diacylglycerol kinase|uniref:Phosphatase PAP2 family protein n=1 Tax=Anaerococcus nagyae TaxID=1755241 RepID=A0A3E2TKR8_9FIRM|nr:MULTISPECIES: diacylglycerol kinase [Anaerococcus]MDU2565322.1 diacylglycerol kinase [Anaerococcus sp.]MDU3211042.1 diacylglycerol kinase [Anaerococcus sp.]RGB77981.1 phosphatase PAP2 family protein [Anaerococcus nagyae]